MKTSVKGLFLFGAFFLGATLTSSTSTLAASTAKDSASDVRAANAQFYTALNSMFTGDVAPMEKVWSHADDVVYMGPDNGYEVGWNKVQANWKKQANQKLKGSVAVENLNIVVGKDLAVVHGQEKGQNLDSKGKPLSVSIRATNIYRLEGGKWKMIAHHTDNLPYLENKTAK